MDMFSRKYIAGNYPELSSELLLRSLRVRNGVKEQAQELFLHVPAFGKDAVFNAARRLSRSGAIYPCSFSVLRFLSHKSALVLEREHGLGSGGVVQGAEVLSLLTGLERDEERLFFLAMLSLAGVLPPAEYRKLSEHGTFRFDDCPAADIVRIEALGCSIVLTPDAFVENINRYPYADYSSVRELTPLLNFGLAVDVEEWLRQTDPELS